MYFKNHLSSFGLLFLLWAPASAADITLTITSDPMGARVVWNDSFVGTTPYSAKFPGGYFHQTAWVTSKVLRTAVNIVLSKPGYEPQQLAITDGPYERRNLNGQSFGQFWIITDKQFHRVLEPERTSQGTSAIDRIRQGRYAPAPVAARTDSRFPGVGQGITIQNSTSYTIRVYLRGPVSRSVTIAPGTSTTVDLPPGSYDEAAEALNSGVIPFYGQHVQEAAASYQVNFMLAAGR